MIANFVAGFLQTILYILTNKTILTIILIITLGFIVLVAFPTSVNLYPVWESKVDYQDFDLFENELPGATSIITVPSWLLADPEKELKVKIFITNTTADELTVNLEVDNRTPYISFINISQLPIQSSITIPPGKTIIEDYEFHVLEGDRRREPTTFVFEMGVDNTSVRKAVQIPMAQIPVPLVAVIGAFIPVVWGLVKFGFKLIGAG